MNMHTTNPDSAARDRFLAVYDALPADEQRALARVVSSLALDPDRPELTADALDEQMESARSVH